jgi:hypothetical protein
MPHAMARHTATSTRRLRRRCKSESDKSKSARTSLLNSDARIYSQRFGCSRRVCHCVTAVVSLVMPLTEDSWLSGCSAGRSERRGGALWPPSQHPSRQSWNHLTKAGTIDKYETEPEGGCEQPEACRPRSRLQYPRAITLPQ